MTITRHLIDRTAFYRGLDIPDDLREWLVREYEWEPFEGFWEESVLEELITLHCQAYWMGNIDTVPPSPAKLWKERFIELHDFVSDMMIDYNELSRCYNQALEVLEEHGIKL